MGLGGSDKNPTVELNKGVQMPQPRTTPKLHNYSKSPANAIIIGAIII